MTLVIRNIDDKLYLVETIETATKNMTSRCVGFVADAKGATFAHLREVKDDGTFPEGWMIMRIARADNKMTIEQLKEDFFKGKTIGSSDQLRQILEQNLNNESMYDTDAQITATRVAK